MFGLGKPKPPNVVALDEGASHWLHVEQPERINARVLSFLAGAG